MMDIQKGTSIIITAVREWHQGAHRFLSFKPFNVDADVFLIGGTFESFDSQGLWFKFHREDDKKTTFTLFIQWRHLLTIVLADDAESSKELKQIGF